MKAAVLTGGVGGAKLVLGLTRLLPAGDLTAIVNTGDDFRHLGLHVSPDIDTILYTLAGKANAAQGWGCEGESWGFMTMLRELGGEDWFQLGDHDLALHVLRTARLASGRTLSAVTRDFAHAWGIGADILPMTDQAVATVLDTEIGMLPFQNYFVERRCEPAVRGISFLGAEGALPAAGAAEAIIGADAVFIAPSNPYLSIDPILAVPGIRAAIEATAAPVVAVSPLVGGQAVKGPTAKLMDELGLAVTNAAIADHYEGLIDGLLVHRGDDVPKGAMAVDCADTMMRTIDDKERVARAAFGLAERIGRRQSD